MTKVWRHAGRWTSLLMVVGFFLPFFGVSCAGQDIVTISGTSMVWGGKPGGMLADSAGMGDMGSGSTTKVEKIDPEPLAIAAFACALIVASLAWVRKKGATIAVLGAAVIGFGAMIGLHQQVGGKLKDQIQAGITAQTPHHDPGDSSLEAGMEDAAREMGNSIQKDMPEIESGARSGFWLVSTLLLFSAVFAGFGLKDPGPQARPPAQMGPPVAYQMVWVPPGQAPPPGSIPPPGGGYPPPA